MTDIKKPLKERLYLDKDQKEIYVDCCNLSQHQIEGVRFLFRQYIKKKPGVILNNPEGYGKSLQIVLFLDSIRELLTNPVLILCEDENKINSWKQTLIKWTKYTEEDIAVDSSNVYVKKKIFLKTGTNLEAPYSRRDWEVVVVKSDFVLKQLLKTPIKANFKLWLTTIDMRKDLEMFNVIYCWMYSEKKFDINKYIDSISDVEGLPLVRAKLINAFLEDIVFIKNDFTPLKKPELTQEKTPPKTKVSRKNKDATGTKIKRSKKTKDSETRTEKNDLDTFNIDRPSIEFKDSKATNSDCKNDQMDYEITNDGLDVENFIKQKEPVECEEYEFLNESNSTDTESMSFTNALNDVIENENDLNEHSESILDEQTNVDVNNLTDNQYSVSPKAITNGTDNKTSKVVEKNKKKDIIQAIAELEEQAMKKFKNTILDDIF